MNTLRRTAVRPLIALGLVLATAGWVPSTGPSSAVVLAAEVEQGGPQPAPNPPAPQPQGTPVEDLTDEMVWRAIERGREYLINLLKFHFG